MLQVSDPVSYIWEPLNINCAYLADRLGFYFHALPPDIERLTLEQLHELIQTVWLTRHDEEIEEEQAARKKDRPLSVKAVDLINIRARETEEYRTGLGTRSLLHSRTNPLSKLSN